MSFPGENTQQDANFEDTSAPQTESNDSEQLDSSAQASPESASQSEPQVPFHQHPRFQELIDKNRQSEERAAQYERQLQEMQARFEQSLKAQPPQQRETNPFVQKLKEIDPKYAEWAESVETRAAKAESLEQQLQQLQYEKLVGQYESAVDKLHSEHKTPDTVKSLIKDQLDAMAMAGRVDLKNVNQVYKTLSDNYNKMLDGVKRAERASYVTDKSKDAAAPSSQPKGKAPTRNDKGQFTGDRETDMALIAKRASKLLKAEGDF